MVLRALNTHQTPNPKYRNFMTCGKFSKHKYLLYCPSTFQNNVNNPSSKKHTSVPISYLSSTKQAVLDLSTALCYILLHGIRNAVSIFFYKTFGDTFSITHTLQTYYK
jgi:hypothetical protein